MSTANVIEEAKRLIEKLPENMTWDELMHEVYVRQSIDARIKVKHYLTEITESRKRARKTQTEINRLKKKTQAVLDKLLLKFGELSSQFYKTSSS